VRHSLASKAKERLERIQASKPGAIVGYERFKTDPVTFALEVFGTELWQGQADICNGVAQHDSVACKSGHKCGKSTSAAVLAWWFALTRQGARVIITAPTERQVKQVIWREIRRLWSLAKKRGFHLPEPGLAPDTGISFDNGSQILGFTAANKEAMAGISAPEILYLVDEASGVAELIFEAIEGNLAGGAKICLTSNPTQTSGQFYRAFHSERQEWHRVSISSEQTPNAIEGRRVIPGLATREWVEKRKRVWGTEDPRYQVRVCGNFPRTAANTVISIGATEAAKLRWQDVTKPTGILRIGLDVARFGDDSSVAQPVRGFYAYEPVEVHGYDSIQVASMVYGLIKGPDSLRPHGERAEVRIDGSGGYGGGVADQLRAMIRDDEELKRAVNVIEVSASEASGDKDYDRRRDELWFSIRNYLDDGGTLPDHDELEGDLLSPTYSFTRAGKIKVESKDEIKKRLGRSPDFGDAFALAVVDLGNRMPIAVHTTNSQAARFSGGRGYG
jgi:phage terminase large subunit